MDNHHHRKSKFFGGQKEKIRQKLDINNGCKGIILTTSLLGTSKKGISEFFNYLQRIEPIEVEYDEPINSYDPYDIEAALDDEINQIKKSQKRFDVFRDITKNVSFIKFMESKDDPNKICKLFFEAVKKEETLPFRFVARLIPVTHLCKPHLADFTRTIKPLIISEFKFSRIALSPKQNELSSANSKERNILDECLNADEPKMDDPVLTRNDLLSSSTLYTEKTSTDPPNNKLNKSSWSCSVSNRNMSSITKQMVFDVLGSCIGDENYYVDLTKPEKTVVIEITPQFCAINFVEDFASYCNFSLIKLSKR